jgi:anti-sigma factor RsiW
MTNYQCTDLDDYLDDLIASADREAFERHLEKCDGCRQAVSFEQSMLEAASASIEDAAVPAAVTAQARAAIRRWQLKCRLAWTAGLAAALLAGFFAYAMRDPANAPNMAKTDRSEVTIDSGPPPPVARDNHTQTARQESGDAAPRPTIVRMLSGAGPPQVALSLPTQSDNVTLVMVFPTPINDRVIIPAKESRRDDVGK